MWLVRPGLLGRLRLGAEEEDGSFRSGAELPFQFLSRGHRLARVPDGLIGGQQATVLGKEGEPPTDVTQTVIAIRAPMDSAMVPNQNAYTHGQEPAKSVSG